MAASEEKAARAYYAMEGAARFETPCCLEAAAGSLAKVAEVTFESLYRPYDYGHSSCLAADINSLDKVARL